MAAIRFHDLVAALMAVGLLVAVVAVVLMDREVPDVLTGAFGAAIGYVFGAQAQRVNNHLNGGRS